MRFSTQQTAAKQRHNPDNYDYNKKDREGNYVNAGTLKSWALSSGKKDEGFKDVKDPL